MITKENTWAQIFVLGYKGPYPSDEFIRLLRNYQIGGVIIFFENIDSPKQLKQVISQLQSASIVPLLMMIDQEGGKTNRITKDFPVFPSNSYFGKIKDEEGVRIAYSTTAKGLKDLGINVNLAPVIDVLNNKRNKLLEERSFGEDAKLVAKLGKIAIKAIKSQGIFPCAKHFPGLGNVELDPHKELPIDQSEQTIFEKVNFVPFASAISAGVEMIMTTHILCEKLDPYFPATLSEIVCQKILREKLGFDGLIISDDMGMGGIAHNREIDFVCNKAFIAGHDIILLAKNWEKQAQVLESFHKAIKDKEISQKRIDISLDRISKLKQRLKK